MYSPKHLLLLAWTRNYSLVCIENVRHAPLQRSYSCLSHIAPRRSICRVKRAKIVGSRCYSEGPKSGDKGFFKSFVENLQKGFEKNKELQDGLKGLQEEREKLGGSYYVQAAKEKWKIFKEKSVFFATKGLGIARETWIKSRETSSRVYKELAETEVAKKGQILGSQIAKSAQQAAEKISEQAAELGKTDVYKTAEKGATVVKEDLLDDVIKESAPYKPPERMRMRSELHEEESTTTIEPNEDVTGVVVTKQSKWKEKWKKLREDNPLSNTMYNLRMKYDESENVFVRASRVVTDKIGQGLSGAVTQSDMAEAIAEIRKVDHSFDKEKFIKDCQFEIIPTILEAYMQGKVEVLKDWCHEASYSVLSTIIKQRAEAAATLLECKVLEVRDVDIVMAKLMDQGPVMVLTFQAQQLTVKKTESGINDELLENIHYVWALCRDQEIYHPKSAWRVLEFGIQSSVKLLV